MSAPQRIVFERSRTRVVALVTVPEPWPEAALFDLPCLGGDAAAYISRDGDLLRITVANGSAVYALNAADADGRAVGQLVEQEWRPPGSLARPTGPYWRVPPLWAGRSVFVLGSGPSLAGVDLARLRGHPVIAINGSFRLAMAAGLDQASQAAVLFFSDTDWWRRNRAEAALWRGPVATTSRAAYAESPERLRLLAQSFAPGFPPPGSEAIRSGRSSGHAAVALGLAGAAAGVVLLGFDMRPDPLTGREHCHDDYAGQTRDLDVYAREFRPAFAGWAQEAAAHGCAIVNATEGSALEEFPCVALADELARAGAPSEAA